MQLLASIAAAAALLTSQVAQAQSDPNNPTCPNAPNWSNYPEMRFTVEEIDGRQVLRITTTRPGGYGHYWLAIDDPRLDPLWATAGELGLPVLIHIADPVAFFEPLDETNEQTWAWVYTLADPAAASFGSLIDDGDWVRSWTEQG